MSTEELVAFSKQQRALSSESERIGVISHLLESLITPHGRLFDKSGFGKSKPNWYLTELADRAFLDNECDQQLRVMFDDFADKVGITNKDLLRRCLRSAIQLKEDKNEGHVWIKCWLHVERNLHHIDNRLDDKQAFDRVMTIEEYWDGFMSEQRELLKKDL